MKQFCIAYSNKCSNNFFSHMNESVTDLALSIQERFSNHEGVVKVDNNNFVYYNKMPGANSGLEIAIKLLDENGKPSSRKFPRIDIETELVYENGIRAPIQPIKPLKLKAGKNISHVVRSEKPIFERLDGEPWLGKKKNSTLFSFVLNEVTYHHHGHDGFKVRASVKYAEDGQKVVVHPAVMNEIITVLSKPKTVGTAQNMQDGGLKLLNSTKTPLNASKKRKSIFQGEDVDDRVAKKSNRPTKMKKEELEQIECIKKANWNGIGKDSVHLATKEVDEIDSLSTLDNQVCSIAISKILHCYKSFGKCSSCLSKIPAGAMCRAIHHSVNCKFAEKIIPLFGNIDPIILQLADEVSMGSEVTTILESESFEECSKAYIANAPFEVFDASIFNTTMSEMDTSHFAPNNNARMCFPTEMTGDYSERTLQFKLDNEDIEPDDIVPMGDIYSSKFETFRSFNGAEVETLEKDKIVNIPYKYTQSDNATCALQYMPEESLLTSRFKAPDMERGRFNSDDTIAGGNAYLSTSEAFRHVNGPEEASLNQDDMLRNNSHLHNQASDFLSFLDHVSKAIN